MIHVSSTRHYSALHKLPYTADHTTLLVCYYGQVCEIESTNRLELQRERDRESTPRGRMLLAGTTPMTPTDVLAFVFHQQTSEYMLPDVPSNTRFRLQFSPSPTAALELLL